MLELKFDYREAWRKWLHDNHDKEDEVWLIFKKKGTQPVTFNYQEALEEALCYGWIDSLVRRINETMYMRKFTPRKTSSIWSATNKKHAEILIQSGRMAGPGMRKIQDAKKNGQWDRKMERPEVSDEIPGALLHAFMTNPLARDNYFKLINTRQKQYNIWINMAKRPETIEKRTRESIHLLEKGEELGLK